MAILGFLFLSWRIVEFFTLIPIIGMLAYFIHGFVASNNLTPTYILVLFIASVLGAAWTLFTTILYLRARHSAGFVALVDLGFVGAFIAGVVVLRGVTSANCSNFNSGDLFVSLGPFGYYGVQSGSSYAKDTNKNCSLLKASFAFGIMECIFFFITFVSFLRLYLCSYYDLGAGHPGPSGRRADSDRTVAGSARRAPPQKGQG